MKPGNKITVSTGEQFTVSLVFNCPFCGGTVGVDEPQIVVMHSMPGCEKFYALDPIEFLHAVVQRANDMAKGAS